MTDTLRRYCICGAAMNVRSDPDTVRAILMWWYQWHTGPPEHGTATRQQAANARRRADRRRVREELQATEAMYR